jgi:hypothetical protein
MGRTHRERLTARGKSSDQLRKVDERLPVGLKRAPKPPLIHCDRGVDDRRRLDRGSHDTTEARASATY